MHITSMFRSISWFMFIFYLRLFCSITSEVFTVYSQHPRPNCHPSFITKLLRHVADLKTHQRWSAKQPKL